MTYKEQKQKKMDEAVANSMVEMDMIASEAVKVAMQSNENMIRKYAESMTSGQRIHYKMLRLGVLPRNERWHELPEDLQNAYERISVHAHLVPTVDEIVERELESMRIN